MLPEIHIKVIPFKAHRKNIGGQVDDYWVDKKGILQIRISDLNSASLEFMLLIHALSEAVLCMIRGIKFSSIDEFDRQFEEQVRGGLYREDEEPGDDIAAPYKREHFFATNIERLLAAELGINWGYYERILNDLYAPKHSGQWDNTR